MLAAGFQDVFEESGKLVELGRPAHEVHLRHASHEGDAVAFGHAADDADDERRIGNLALLQGAQTRPDFLLGTIADGAGVVKDHVSICEGRREVVTDRAELGLDELGVEDVHLSAEGFEVDFFHG